MDKQYKTWFNGVEYDTQIRSTEECGQRGNIYLYALLKDRHIVTFGKELGNYTGGIEAETPEQIEKYCDGLKQSSNPFAQSLYTALKQAGVKDI